jgi:hypothetical protein
MSITHKLGAALLVAGIAGGVPATASADVPSRIASKLHRAEKALDRAQSRADDGNTEGAVKQLTAVRRSLAAAQRAAERRTSSAGVNGPDADAAVVETQHAVVIGSVDILDGATGDLADAAIATLDAGLDGRDALLLAVDGLEDADEADYADVWGIVASDADDEVETIADSLSDDELTDEARTALQAGSEQASAAGTAADVKVATFGSSDEEAEGADDEGDRPCRRGPRGDGERRGFRPGGDGEGFAGPESGFEG